MKRFADATTESWHFDFELPTTHPSALRCLARLMCDPPGPTAIRSFEGAEVTARPSELIPIQSVSDEMPVIPLFAVNDSPAGRTPPWPRHFGRKHMSMDIVSRVGTEAAVKDPIERTLRAWAGLANKGFADPFHGWSWGPDPEIRSMFPDEFNARVDALTCGPLGLQALLSALNHVAARVAPLERFTYT
ncbi:MAG: hypothetical protein U0414_08665 [Polyangiaceae bacterium]